MNKKTVLTTILALALMATVLSGCKKKTGGGATGGGGADTVWIKVNGKEIMKSQVEEEMSRFRQQLSASGQMSAEQVTQMEPMIKREAMQRVVQAAVLEQQADEAKIVIDDAAVDKELAELKGKFPSADAFQQRLKELNLTEADLRAELKKSLRFQKLLEEKVVVPDPAEEEILKTYDSAKDRLLQPAKATVNYIFISVPTTATEEEKKKRKELAETVLKQLQGGGDFKALAQQYSEASNKSEGGKETFTQGTQVKELDEAIFKGMKPGELSKVIETPMGFYIVKLEEITPEKTQTLDEVRADIIKFLKQNKQQEGMQTYVEGLVAKAKVEYVEPLPEMPAQMPGMGGMMPPGGPGGGDEPPPPPSGPEGAPMPEGAVPGAGPEGAAPTAPAPEGAAPEAPAAGAPAAPAAGAAPAAPAPPPAPAPKP